MDSRGDRFGACHAAMRCAPGSAPRGHAEGDSSRGCPPKRRAGPRAAARRPRAVRGRVGVDAEKGTAPNALSFAGENSKVEVGERTSGALQGIELEAKHSAEKANGQRVFPASHFDRKLEGGALGRQAFAAGDQPQEHERSTCSSFVSSVASAAPAGGDDVTLATPWPVAPPSSGASIISPGAHPLPAAGRAPMPPGSLFCSASECQGDPELAVSACPALSLAAGAEAEDKRTHTSAFQNFRATLPTVIPKSSAATPAASPANSECDPVNRASANGSSLYMDRKTISVGSGALCAGLSFPPVSADAQRKLLAVKKLSPSSPRVSSVAARVLARDCCVSFHGLRASSYPSKSVKVGAVLSRAPHWAVHVPVESVSFQALRRGVSLSSTLSVCLPSNELASWAFHSSDSPAFGGPLLLPHASALPLNATYSCGGGRARPKGPLPFMAAIHTPSAKNILATPKGYMTRWPSNLWWPITNALQCETDEEENDDTDGTDTTSEMLACPQEQLLPALAQSDPHAHMGISDSQAPSIHPNKSAPCHGGATQQHTANAVLHQTLQSVELGGEEGEEEANSQGNYAPPVSTRVGDDCHPEVTPANNRSHGSVYTDTDVSARRALQGNSHQMVEPRGEVSQGSAKCPDTGKPSKAGNSPRAHPESHEQALKSDRAKQQHETQLQTAPVVNKKLHRVEHKRAGEEEGIAQAEERPSGCESAEEERGNLRGAEPSEEHSEGGDGPSARGLADKVEEDSQSTEDRLRTHDSVSSTRVSVSGGPALQCRSPLGQLRPVKPSEAAGALAGPAGIEEGGDRGKPEEDVTEVNGTFDEDGRAPIVPGLLDEPPKDSTLVDPNLIAFEVAEQSIGSSKLVDHSAVCLEVPFPRVGVVLRSDAIQEDISTDGSICVAVSSSSVSCGPASSVQVGLATACGAAQGAGKAYRGPNESRADKSSAVGGISSAVRAPACVLLSAAASRDRDPLPTPQSSLAPSRHAAAAAASLPCFAVVGGASARGALPPTPTPSVGVAAHLPALPRPSTLPTPAHGARNNNAPSLQAAPLPADAFCANVPSLPCLAPPPVVCLPPRSCPAPADKAVVPLGGNTPSHSYASSGACAAQPNLHQHGGAPAIGFKRPVASNEEALERGQLPYSRCLAATLPCDEQADCNERHLPREFVETAASQQRVNEWRVGGIGPQGQHLVDPRPLSPNGHLAPESRLVGSTLVGCPSASRLDCPPRLGTAPPACVLPLIHARGTDTGVEPGSRFATATAATPTAALRPTNERAPEEQFKGGAPLFSWQVSQPLMVDMLADTHDFSLRGLPFDSWDLVQIPTMGATVDSRCQTMYRAHLPPPGEGPCKKEPAALTAPRGVCLGAGLGASCPTEESAGVFVKVIPAAVWRQQLQQQEEAGGFFVTDGEHFVAETATLAFLTAYHPGIAPRLLAVLREHAEDDDVLDGGRKVWAEEERTPPPTPRAAMLNSPEQLLAHTAFGCALTECVPATACNSRAAAAAAAGTAGGSARLEEPTDISAGRCLVKASACELPHTPLQSSFSGAPSAKQGAQRGELKNVIIITELCEKDLLDYLDEVTASPVAGAAPEMPSSAPDHVGVSLGTESWHPHKHTHPTESAPCVGGWSCLLFKRALQHAAVVLMCRLHLSGLAHLDFTPENILATNAGGGAAAPGASAALAALARSGPLAEFLDLPSICTEAEGLVPALRLCDFAKSASLCHRGKASDEGLRNLMFKRSSCCCAGATASTAHSPAGSGCRRTPRWREARGQQPTAACATCTYEGEAASFRSCEPTVGKGPYMPPECWGIVHRLRQLGISSPFQQVGLEGFGEDTPIAATRPLPNDRQSPDFTSPDSPRLVPLHAAPTPTAKTDRLMVAPTSQPCSIPPPLCIEEPSNRSSQAAASRPTPVASDGKISTQRHSWAAVSSDSEWSSDEGETMRGPKHHDRRNVANPPRAPAEPEHAGFFILDGNRPELSDYRDVTPRAPYGAYQEAGKSSSLGSPTPCHGGSSALEVRSSLRFDVHKADVYMLGVLLFVMWADGGVWTVSDVKQDLQYRELVQTGMDFTVFSDCQEWPEQFRHLLSRLLHPDPQQRPSAAQALRHPWWKQQI
eukprot:GHVT01088119.1.p1 GENE.GHVT01088119.1~~GHVT01088119.1.p1  ORF type:complete len:2103 (+),score=419.30 GHVT01088119.1:2965-9273(+)